MTASVSIADLRVDELVSRIAGNHISPGAGAAGAVALALAAACAAKAVSISLRHRADDIELQQALAIFTDISRRALNDAERDAEAFEVYIHAKDAPTAARLVCEGENLAHLIAELLARIGDIEARIASSMAGDVAAARALAVAARTIQERNEAETKAALPDV
jgi:hypothetical protein